MNEVRISPRAVRISASIAQSGAGLELHRASERPRPAAPSATINVPVGPALTTPETQPLRRAAPANRAAQTKEILLTVLAGAGGAVVGGLIGCVTCNPALSLYLGLEGALIGAALAQSSV